MLKRSIAQLIERVFKRLHKHRKIALFAADSIVFIAVSTGMCVMATRDAATRFPEQIWASFAILYVTTMAAHLFFGSYRSLWRYASTRDYLRLVLAAAAGYALFALIAIVSAYVWLALIATLGTAIACLLCNILGRMIYRSLREWSASAEREQTKDAVTVAIIGAGSAGSTLARDLMRSESPRYRVYGFFDDDPEKIGSQIKGIPMLGKVEQMAEKLQGSPVQEIILAIPTLSAADRKEILNRLKELPYRVKVLPDTAVVLAKGNANLAQAVRSVAVEDLLARNTIQLDTTDLKAVLTDQTVLVTGGGGSIGSELCRQIAVYKPKLLVIFDIAENTTYTLRQELTRLYGSDLRLRVEIGSIRDERKVNELFAKYQPDVVYHAAAHKHVPLMEWNPEEAVKNNVFGTWNVIQAAVAYKAKAFVQISTDKAVSPTSVMGATKRYCEMMIHAAAQKPGCATKFCAVRFGNVLGSSGSVVPLFREQIANGGPVTVTDKRITRFFMTIPEAVNLVLTAGAMAKNNELFVLDMGEPVKIWDLAENMVRLSRLKPGEDIEILETGLRPGEKLYEELLLDPTKQTKTDNDRIFVENENSDKTEADVQTDLAALAEVLTQNNPDLVVQTLRRLVPTYKTPRDVDIHNA